MKTQVSSISEKKVTVVGGGLVGSLLSVALARRGYEVTLIERRSDMRKTRSTEGRSINLAISTRGFFALEKQGLAGLLDEHTLPMRGRRVHPLSSVLNENTVLQPYGKAPKDAIYSMSRAGLNRVLLDAAEATGKVEIVFDTKVLGVNLDRGMLEVERSGQKETRDCAFVIGADGSASVLRGVVLKDESSRDSVLSHGYKELTLPPSRSGAFLMDSEALHIWPRKEFMLIALPNRDASFTCTLFLQNEGPAQTTTFADLNTSEQVERFFEKEFADVKPHFEKFPQTFFENPTGKMTTVRSPRWFRKGEKASALLIGDAAHAIVPFFGQGANCGFEDVTVLSELLDLSGQRGLDADLCVEFESLRIPNANAIADMAIENFVEMRDKVVDPVFLEKKAIEKRLLTQFEGDYFSRYQLVSFSRVPYRTAFDLGLITESILEEIRRAISSDEAAQTAFAQKLIEERLTPFVKERGIKKWISN